MQSVLFVVPNPNLVDPEQPAAFTSVIGLVKSIETFFENPKDATEGAVTVTFIAFHYALSSFKLADSINKLETFICNSKDKVSAVNLYIGAITIPLLNDMELSGKSFSEAVRNATDEDHSLDMFKIKPITDSLSNTTRAHLGISASIEARLDGTTAASPIDPNVLAAKIFESSKYMQLMADAANNVKGVTVCFFGIAACGLLVDCGLQKLSDSLNALANVISNLSESLFAELVSALHDWTKTQKNIKKAYQDLSKVWPKKPLGRI